MMKVSRSTLLILLVLVAALVLAACGGGGGAAPASQNPAAPKGDAADLRRIVDCVAASHAEPHVER